MRTRPRCAWNSPGERRSTAWASTYPDADGRFDLYDDSGDGFGYEQGEFTYTSLRWCDAEDRFLVEAAAGAGGDRPAHRDFRPVVVGAGDGLGPSEPAMDGPVVHCGGRPVSRRLR
ncbi:DUF5110 domain-containing protein [Streptomyces sp. NPDC088350]|uniref:DUF5110 domain-containing protein n=1 Tax=Streptomyces sp. NPDC088350 TaxID=3365854 RepID=UPI0038096C98